MKRLLIIISIILISAFNTAAQDEPAGKISGTVFLDYLYNVSRDPGNASISDAALKGAQDFNGFDLRRAYFTYDYKFSKTFSSRFRVEADYKSNANNGKYGMAVKDAYLKWKNIFDGSDLIIGIQSPPAFVVSEKYWGYRSLEKTILDLRKIVSSRDLGITLKGNLTSNGVVKYWITIGNGSSNKPEADKYKRFYAHLDFQPVKNLRITAYGDYETQPDINIPDGTIVGKKTMSNNILTTALFVGYKEKGVFSLGAEGFYQSEQNGLAVNQNRENMNAIGLSLFGSWDINDKFSAMGRFDHFDPVTDSDFEGDSRNLIIAGISYKPEDNIAVIPNIMIETYEDLPNGQSFDSSVTARVTLHYNF